MILFPDGTRYVEAERPGVALWRVKHDFELPGGVWRAGLPEVFVLNEEITPFGKDWQELSYALNPGMDRKKWRALYSVGKAFNNTTGFSDTEPRADHINGLNLDATLPRWDKCRVCGGAWLAGLPVGMELVVEVMDGRGAAPSLSWLLERPWLYFRAVNSVEGGITNFPHRDGMPVYIPLVGSGEARISLSKLEKVKNG